MRTTSRLIHCLVNDELFDVSEFAHLPPKRRPNAVCYECRSPLVLKLGKSGKRIHHAAHKAFNSQCPLTTPEGALHFNTKVYIFNQLKKGSKLFIRQLCSGWTLPGYKPSCRRSIFRPQLWLENWDDVKMEQTVGRLRPDILIYREGKPLGAVEVCVTHAVSEEKELALREMNLPWVEIKAQGENFDEYFIDWAEGFEEEDCPWKIEKPLRADKCFPDFESWTCEYCIEEPEIHARRLAEREERMAKADDAERSERLRKIAEEKEKERREQRYNEKFDNKILFARAIILTDRFGDKEFIETFVVERSNPDPPYDAEELYLKEGRYGGKILISEDPITNESRNKIKDHYKYWLKVKTAGQKNIDSTPWLEENEYNKIVDSFKSEYL